MHERTVTVTATASSKLRNAVACGPHALVADEPLAVGGTDEGPPPFELLAAALGACTNMTLRLYADRKGYALEGLEVTLEQREPRDPSLVRHIVRTITLRGELDADARGRLLAIANKCPVHRALEGSRVQVETRLGD
ncbi:MAG: OsmC family protein [Myxococcales bacterium]|nr:OsmC family protein [Myxococcales bacterium]HQY63329.1 OsmC family protein [Polyangiaceae bacterium]